MRLCALWDSIELEKENVPTIIELINQPEVVEALAQETASHWEGVGGVILNPSDDPELQALETAAFQRSNKEFGAQQAQEARASLCTAIDNARAIMASSRLQGIMNLRDKHLAHSLTETRREKAGPIAPMNKGTSAQSSMTPCQSLGVYCWVNG